MEWSGIAAITYLVIVIFLIKYTGHRKMVVSKKNRNRKRELIRLQRQEETLETELEEIVEEIASEDNEELNKAKFEIARKLSQARQEITTLRKRIR